MAKPRSSFQAEIADLKKVVKHGKSILGVITGVASLSPLAGYFTAGFFPPWQPILGIAVAASLMGLLFAFLFLRHLSSAILFRGGAVLVVLGLFSLLVYSFDASERIFEHEGARIVIGTRLSKSGTNVFDRLSTNGISPSTKDLLADVGFNHATSIWSDVVEVRRRLCALLLAGFALTSTGFFLAILRNLALDRETSPLEESAGKSGGQKKSVTK
jgi:hypothetical protein